MGSGPGRVRSTSGVSFVLLVVVIASAAVAGCTDDASLGRPVADAVPTTSAPAPPAPAPPAPAPPAPAPPETVRPTDPRRPSWDMVVHAREAVVADGLGPLAGSQVLEFRGTDPMVVAFTDRPARLAGTMRLDEFLALWHGGSFGTDPPNAAIDLDGTTVVVELRRAAYHPGSARIAFAVRPLPGPTGSPGIPLPVGRHGPVTAFVDAYPMPVDGQVTDEVTQANVTVLGAAPSMAMGDLYQTIRSSLAVAGAPVGPAGNATASDNDVYDAQAVTDQPVAVLYGVDTAASPTATATVDASGPTPAAEAAQIAQQLQQFGS